MADYLSTTEFKTFYQSLNAKGKEAYRNLFGDAQTLANDETLVTDSGGQKVAFGGRFYKTPDTTEILELLIAGGKVVRSLSGSTLTLTIQSANQNDTTIKRILLRNFKELLEE